MQSSQAEVTALFRQSGYDTCPQVASNPELLLFDSGFAGIGVFLAQTAGNAVDIWLDLQATVAKVRTQRPRGSLKDWYLVFIVPEVQAEDVPGIQDIINDTHVCRKIVLERQGRSLPDVLNEIPFFRLETEPMIANSEQPEEAVELARPGLPAKLLADLAKRSPSVIIKCGLRGKYKSGAKHDEA